MNPRISKNADGDLDIIMKTDAELCKDTLYGEGKQGIKKSFQLATLSFLYFLTGTYYLFKGFPRHFQNKFIKKVRVANILVVEKPWIDAAAGLDVSYHFPTLIKNTKDMKTMIFKSKRKSQRRRNHDEEVKTYEELMSEKYEDGDEVYHFGTGANGKEIV